jgi:hypothetical protein
MARTLIPFGIAGLLMVCSTLEAQKRGRNEVIPLKWLPTTELAELGPVNLTGVSGVTIALGPFDDAREAAFPDELVARGVPYSEGLFGVNLEDTRPKQATTPDSIPAFVADRLAYVVDALGFTVVENPEDADVVVGGELRRFIVTEVKTYEGEVLFLARVTDRAGETLLEALVTGSASRFGRSYKDENYYETLSDALLEAGYNLVTVDGFLEALVAVPGSER